MKKKIIIFSIFIATAFLAGGYYLSNYFGVFTPEVKPNQKVFLSEEGSYDEIKKEVSYTVEPVVKNLSVSWSIVFTSDSRILVSEREGNIKEYDLSSTNPSSSSRNLISFSEVSSTAEEGLMGLALDPKYSQNSKIYACLAYTKGSEMFVKVVSLLDRKDQIVFERNVIADIPSARFHAGCRLGFGPDQKLYVSTGDASKRDLAQSMESLAGKILRINSDGSVPADNPTEGSLVYALGLRNTQGFDWHPENGQMYATDHGPSIFDGPAGGDELNIIFKGANYGWPVVSHEKVDERFVSPLLVFTPAVAPSGLLVYSSEVYPQFKNNLFFALLRGEGVIRAMLSEDGRKVNFFEKILTDYGRVRDIVESPTGEIYFATSNTDGRGKAQSEDDKIYKLVPNK